MMHAILLLLLLVTATAHAGRKMTTASGKKHPNTIEGACSLVPNTANPFPGPCVSTLLILKDLQGKEIANTRTDLQGRFDFIAEIGKSYRIDSGSRFYSVVTPTQKDVIHCGDAIKLELQQK